MWVLPPPIWTGILSLSVSQVCSQRNTAFVPFQEFLYLLWLCSASNGPWCVEPNGFSENFLYHFLKHCCWFIWFRIRKSSLAFLKMFTIFERENASRGGTERGGQKIQSRLHADSSQPDVCGGWTHEPWDHDLNQNQMFNWLSHPCAPTCLLSLLSW